MATLLLLVAPVGVGAPPPSFDHSEFDAILRDAVHHEKVDYRRIRALHFDRLTEYLDRLARFDPAPLAEPERLSWYINLYNATMIRAVVERYEPGYSPSRALFAVFDEPLVAIGGTRISLDRLEHEIIRPTFKDPRIHVALVCAARSCPPLLPRAYLGEDLDRVLEENMRRFVNDPGRNRIDTAARELRLSRIFKWYADDFGGAARIADYVNRYTAADVAGFTVSFLPYSWELNETRRDR